MTVDELNEWLAFRQIEPEPVARLTEVLKRFAASQCVTPDRQPVDPAVFDQWDDSEDAGEVSPDAAVMSMRTTMGAG